jgi:hypothetical protein
MICFILPEDQIKSSNFVLSGVSPEVVVDINRESWFARVIDTQTGFHVRDDTERRYSLTLSSEKAAVSVYAS